ncbi:hypothetical protein ACFWRR_10825 [Streptomyces cellulosae]
MQTAPAHEGRPAGAPGRLAVPVAGTDPGARKLIMELVDDTGFDPVDPVDAGTADDGRRTRAGTPACCTGLDAERLRRALALAGPEAARVRREAVLAVIGSWSPDDRTFEDIVALNRAAAGPHRLLGEQT